MGRIKTSRIKRVTEEVIERFGNELTNDYSKNKVIINNHLITQSKKIKNIVAGYATRITKAKSE